MRILVKLGAIAIILGTILFVGSKLLRQKAVDPYSPEADAAYQTILTKLKQAQGVSFRYATHDPQNPKFDTQGTFLFSAPNRFRSHTNNATRVSDGETVYSSTSKTKQYSHQSAIAFGTRPYGFFWGFEGLLKTKVEMKRSNPQFSTYEGKRALLVRYTNSAQDTKSAVEVFYSLENSLPLACVFKDEVKNQGTLTNTLTYSDVVLNPKIAKNTFIFKPEPGYTFKDVKNISKVIKVGATSPDFEVVNIDGKTIKRSSLLASNKALLIFFWKHG